jgi:hypothetical protein
VVPPKSPTAKEKYFSENTLTESPASINNYVKLTIMLIMTIMLIPRHIQKAPTLSAERTIKENMCHRFLLLLCT